MIELYKVKQMCREGEIEKIENYEQAMADKEHTWVCHHRFELTMDGEFANYRKDLIRMGMYYNRPAFELIFMTKTDHMKMHAHVQPVSEESRAKMRAAKLCKPGVRKGMKLSEETKEKLRQVNLGKKHTDDTRAKISAANKLRWERYRQMKKEVSNARK